MSVEIYSYLMLAPWSELWLRGDAELDDDQAHALHGKEGSR